MAKTKTKKEEPLEKVLWATANKLRKNIDAAEYKHVVLGLIFLRYISDAFSDLYNKLEKGEGEYAGADPEDKDEYKAENVFFVPSKAKNQTSSDASTATRINSCNTTIQLLLVITYFFVMHTQEKTCCFVQPGFNVCFDKIAKQKLCSTIIVLV